MAFRRVLTVFAAVASSIITLQANAAVPTLLSAVSRIAHGTAGAHDVPLPLTGGTGIEPRNITGGFQVVVTFDQPVKAGTVTVSAGTATAGTPSFSNYTVTVPLTGVANAQSITLSLANVTATTGEVLASASISFRTLYGDVNGDSFLSASDLSIVRAAIATNAGVTNGNFRSDLNADGLLGAADVSLERAAIAAGASVDGGATNNTPPSMTAISNQTVVTGTPMSPIGFTVADNESDPSLLSVVASSSDQLTIPNENISVTGSGASRSISLTPAAGITAPVAVTLSLYVSDGLAFSPISTFTVTVTPPPIVYLATLTPIAGTNSLGTGTAVLTVSGDRTYATLRYGYSNLSSTVTDDAIFDGTDSLMYDIPVGRSRGDLQPDGSLKWTFNTAKTQSILASLASNTAYLLADTSTHLTGELKGAFKSVNGSQIFVPPADPPPITINPPSPADASRFLQQAAFGGTYAEIAALSNTSAANASTAIDDWLTAQFNKPLPISPTYAANSTAPPATLPAAQSTTQPYTDSSMYATLYNRVCLPQAPNAYGDSYSTDRIHEAWWRNAVKADDSLRQRVATALSELFVVSEIDGTIAGNPAGLASYYDMLADDAFGNFRTILGDVTLHPIMGKYLNMLGNGKAIPNENYAREIMQLFSIGLYMLQPDGTLQLDAYGNPIPTYPQSTVTSAAAVYTGWNFSSVKPVIPTLIAPVAPATQPTVSNVTSSYQQPMVVTASNHSTAAKQLLLYPGAAKYGAATQPAYIPATSSMTVTVANNELNFALDNIFNHPNVGPFVARALIQRLVESNPSPGYVYRVAKKFDDNGSGVRGDMKAVIKAILTDYEARSPQVQTAAGYGHMREPIIRFASILHSLNAVSKTGKWAFGRTDSTLAQTIFRSPTVFNFFDPDYSLPGGIQQAGLASPEFDIIYETTIMNAQNMIYTGIYSNYYTDTTQPGGTPKLTGTGFRGDNYGSDVYLDFSTAGNGLWAIDQANGASSPALLNRVVLLLNGNSLDTTGDAQNRILTFLKTITGTTNANSLSRVEAAVHLVATSPQCAAQK